jgi:hypothetical protein
MKTRFFSLSSLLLLSLTFLLIFCATQVATAQVPSYVPTNGLVGYWPFNGNANDESGNGNNGTVNGATLAADRFGELDKAYSFDGVNDFIEISSLNNSAYAPVTYSLWFKANQLVTVEFPLGNQVSLIGRDLAGVGNQGDIGFWHDPNISVYQRLHYYTGSSGQLFDFSPSTNTWYNLVFVYSSSYIMSVFIDGQLINEVFFEGSALSADIPFRIGAGTAFDGIATRFNWNGYIDDIGIWNRALTADEVLALYNGCDIASLAVSGNITPTQFTQETYTYPNTVGSTYSWTVTNGVILSGQGTNSIDVTWANSGVGSVSVVETNASNCTGDEVTYNVVVIPTNVEELSSQLILYPNPATTELNLQTTAELIGSDLFIFDALGKQIHKQQIISTNTRINTSAFAAGNYVVKVGEGVKKFTVEK